MTVISACLSNILSRTKRCCLSGIALLAISRSITAACASEVSAHDFGAKGDGISDDGPAIQRAVKALSQVKPPCTLKFERGKVYRIRTAEDTWLIRLSGLREVTIEGNGSTFLLDPKTRFLHMTGCAKAVVRGLSVDFDPLPFVDGVVVAADPVRRSIDVRVYDDYSMPPLGGPTGDREQAYFAMLWHPGPHSLIGEHYFLRDTQEAYPGSVRERIIRAFAAPETSRFAGIRPGVTQISLPVRGIAHRMEGHGASPVFVIEENADVACYDIEIWSSPLFAVKVARNRGACTFQRFHIRPKPGTRRLTSSWRDGFHVKGNYARLLWEECHLEGMNDDSFNTATHSSRVIEAVSASSIRVRQIFPLGFVPFQKGDRLGAYDVSGRRRLGAVRVVRVEPEEPVNRTDPDRPAPPLKITFSPALPEIEAGDLVWNESSANPNTTIRRCKIMNSCRFQSPVRVEDCEITAFCWFYGDDLEGPLPQRVVIKKSRFQLGRGNPEMVISFNSLISGADGKIAVPTEPVIRDVVLENNTLDGRLDIRYVSNLRLIKNRLLPPGGEIAIRQSRNIVMRDNRLGEDLLNKLEMLTIEDEPTRRAISIR